MTFYHLRMLYSFGQVLNKESIKSDIQVGGCGIFEGSVSALACEYERNREHV
jgi:hypothetical protein